MLYQGHFNQRVCSKDWPTRRARQMMSQKRLQLISLFLLASVSLAAKAPAQDASLSHGLLGDKVVVVDAGHGGHDPGAVGPSGLAEKDVTLALAKKIKDALAANHTVYLTRDGDYWLDIEKRTAVANHHRADVFISLHAGGSLHHEARGLAVFYYGAETAQGFSAEPAAPVGDGGQTLPPWDQIQLRHTAKSKRLADLLHNELLAGFNPMDRGIDRAPCFVLRGADMPAVLVEIGYVTHPAEEKVLKDPGSMSTVAEAVSQGIKAFFRQTNGCINKQGMIKEKIGAGRGAAW
jgi:N-acetylmuramoyl-L-alanine amidase